jgi:hypothetical protein
MLSDRPFAGILPAVTTLRQVGNLTIMPKRIVYNVQPAGGGNWEVKKQRASRASNVFENKQDAIDRGRQLAKRPALGQLRVKDGEGVVQTEWTYGADPRRFKG